MRNIDMNTTATFYNQLLRLIFYFCTDVLTAQFSL